MTRLFCSQFDFVPFPVSETNLCCFVAYLYSQNLSTPLVSYYISALRFHQTTRGGPDLSLQDFPILHYLLRTTRRLASVSSCLPRLPTIHYILHSLFSVWSIPPVTYSHCMLWAALFFFFFFFAFLCSGEFTVSSSSLVPTISAQSGS